MSNSAETSPNQRPDLEEELMAAMSEFADATPAPAYRADAFLPTRHRGNRVRWALAAVVVAVAAGGGSLALLPHHSGTAPATVRPSHRPSPRPSGSASADSGAGFTRMHELDTLVSAAEMYENPASRSQVNLGQVRALFTDQAAFTRTWGTDGTGVTCGSVVNGAINGALDGRVNDTLTSSNTDILLFSGTTRLSQEMSPVWGPGDSIELDGVTCRARTSQPGDPVVSNYFGLLAKGSTAGDALVKTSVQVPAECLNGKPMYSWYADWPVASGSTLAWNVTLNGGVTWPTAVTVSGGAEISATDCNPYTNA